MEGSPANNILWEQGLPAMNTTQSPWNRGACIASKLCSHRYSVAQSINRPNPSSKRCNAP
ncbi:hypothetical protein DZG01_28630 [Pseudomonas fluorescens]|nr:hypothetical protein DZG01_28630 [Pseudomonas fluorescens]